MKSILSVTRFCRFLELKGTKIMKSREKLRQFATIIGLLYILLLDPVTSAPVTVEESEYEVEDGCYYMLDVYKNGEQIRTNEPCLNCTCAGTRLLCYLQTCPFSKPIGKECSVERVAGQCCPTIRCPEVPVMIPDPLLYDPPATSFASSATVWPTAPAATLDSDEGCYLDDDYFVEGSRIPPMSNDPCDLCYCIHNRTACVKQQCLLEIPGCQPKYQQDTCCPYAYDCDNSVSFTTPPTTTTTTVLPLSGCYVDEQYYYDGSVIPTGGPCEHCYCMQGKLVCAMQDCIPPVPDCLPIFGEDECCPERYDCATTRTPPTTYSTATPPLKDEASVLSTTSSIPAEHPGVVTDDPELSVPAKGVTTSQSEAAHTVSAEDVAVEDNVVEATTTKEYPITESTGPSTLEPSEVRESETPEPVVAIRDDSTRAPAVDADVTKAIEHQSVTPAEDPSDDRVSSTVPPLADAPAEPSTPDGAEPKPDAKDPELEDKIDDKPARTDTTSLPPSSTEKSNLMTDGSADAITTEVAEATTMELVTSNDDDPPNSTIPVQPQAEGLNRTATVAEEGSTMAMEAVGNEIDLITESSKAPESDSTTLPKDTSKQYDLVTELPSSPDVTQGTLAITALPPSIAHLPASPAVSGERSSEAPLEEDMLATLASEPLKYATSAAERRSTPPLPADTSITEAPVSPEEPHRVQLHDEQDTPRPSEPPLESGSSEFPQDEGVSDSPSEEVSSKQPSIDIATTESDPAEARTEEATLPALDEDARATTEALSQDRLSSEGPLVQDSPAMSERLPEATHEPIPTTTATSDLPETQPEYEPTGTPAAEALSEAPVGDGLIEASGYGPVVTSAADPASPAPTADDSTVHVPLKGSTETPTEIATEQVVASDAHSTQSDDLPSVTEIILDAEPSSEAPSSADVPDISSAGHTPEALSSDQSPVTPSAHTSEEFSNEIPSDAPSVDIASEGLQSDSTSEIPPGDIPSRTTTVNVPLSPASGTSTVAVPYEQSATEQSSSGNASEVPSDDLLTEFPSDVSATTVPSSDREEVTIVSGSTAPYHADRGTTTDAKSPELPPPSEVPSAVNESSEAPLYDHPTSELPAVTDVAHPALGISEVQPPDESSTQALKIQTSPPIVHQQEHTGVTLVTGPETTEASLVRDGTISLPPKDIPGEGDCEQDGVTYQSGDRVPSKNGCAEKCTCQRSIIICDKMECPVPDFVRNFTCTELLEEGRCCPRYVCHEPSTTGQGPIASGSLVTEAAVNATASERIDGEESTTVEEEGDSTRVPEQLPVTKKPSAADPVSTVYPSAIVTDGQEHEATVVQDYTVAVAASSTVSTKDAPESRATEHPTLVSQTVAYEESTQEEDDDETAPPDSVFAHTYQPEDDKHPTSGAPQDVGKITLPPLTVSSRPATSERAEVDDVTREPSTSPAVDPSLVETAPLTIVEHQPISITTRLPTTATFPAEAVDATTATSSTKVKEITEAPIAGDVPSVTLRDQPEPSTVPPEDSETQRASVDAEPPTSSTPQAGEHTEEPAAKEPSTVPASQQEERVGTDTSFNFTTAAGVVVSDAPIVPETTRRPPLVTASAQPDVEAVSEMVELPASGRPASEPFTTHAPEVVSKVESLAEQTTVYQVYGDDHHHAPTTHLSIEVEVSQVDEGTTLRPSISDKVSSTERSDIERTVAPSDDNVDEGTSLRPSISDKVSSTEHLDVARTEVPDDKVDEGATLRPSISDKVSSTERSDIERPVAPNDDKVDEGTTLRPSISDKVSSTEQLDVARTEVPHDKVDESTTLRPSISDKVSSTEHLDVARTEVPDNEVDESATFRPSISDKVSSTEHLDVARTEVPDDKVDLDATLRPSISDKVSSTERSDIERTVAPNDDKVDEGTTLRPSISDKVSSTEQLDVARTEVPHDKVDEGATLRPSISDKVSSTEHLDVARTEVPDDKVDLDATLRPSISDKVSSTERSDIERTVAPSDDKVDEGTTLRPSISDKVSSTDHLDVARTEVPDDEVDEGATLRPSISDKASSTERSDIERTVAPSDDKVDEVTTLRPSIFDKVSSTERSDIERTVAPSDDKVDEGTTLRPSILDKVSSTERSDIERTVAPSDDKVDEDTTLRPSISDKVSSTESLDVARTEVPDDEVDKGATLMPSISDKVSSTERSDIERTVAPSDDKVYEGTTLRPSILDKASSTERSDIERTVAPSDDKADDGTTLRPSSSDKVSSTEHLDVARTEVPDDKVDEGATLRPSISDKVSSTEHLDVSRTEVPDDKVDEGITLWPSISDKVSTTERLDVARTEVPDDDKVDRSTTLRPSISDKVSSTERLDLERPVEPSDVKVDEGTTLRSSILDEASTKRSDVEKTVVPDDALQPSQRPSISDKVTSTAHTSVEGAVVPLDDIPSSHGPSSSTVAAPTKTAEVASEESIADTTVKDPAAPSKEPDTTVQPQTLSPVADALSTKTEPSRQDVAYGTSTRPAGVVDQSLSTTRVPEVIQEVLRTVPVTEESLEKVTTEAGPWSTSRVPQAVTFTSSVSPQLGTTRAHPPAFEDTQADHINVTVPELLPTVPALNVTTAASVALDDTTAHRVEISSDRSTYGPLLATLFPEMLSTLTTSSPVTSLATSTPYALLTTLTTTPGSARTEPPTGHTDHTSHHPIIDDNEGHPEHFYPDAGVPITSDNFTLEDGECVYESRIYSSALQIPRDDPCDFCFCFRGDIICLQQSCPPPIDGCHEESIPGFCCPRYECPVTAVTLNLTDSKAPYPVGASRYRTVRALTQVQVIVCEFRNKFYSKGESISPASGPCMDCLCGEGGAMKCIPKKCQLDPFWHLLPALKRLGGSGEPFHAADRDGRNHFVNAWDQ